MKTLTIDGQMQEVVEQIKEVLARIDGQSEPTAKFWITGNEPHPLYTLLGKIVFENLKEFKE